MTRHHGLPDITGHTALAVRPDVLNDKYRSCHNKCYKQLSQSRPCTGKVQTCHKYWNSLSCDHITLCKALDVAWYNRCLNPKRAGLFGPISQPGGILPPKISETDWRNIKCVVLVDSYNPPKSIGTKKVQTYLVWRHSDIISDVMSKTRKSPKIAKIMVFRYFFKQKLLFLAMMCVKVCLHMFLLQINQINKIKHSESVSWKQKNTICV